jgi:hypothetical protein
MLIVSLRQCGMAHMVFSPAPHCYKDTFLWIHEKMGWKTAILGLEIWASGVSFADAAQL